jgi:hypothetical protein
MTNPLDPVYDAYNINFGALKVAYRCITLDTINAERPFRRTIFHHKEDDVNLQMLKVGQAELNDLTVLALYAAFERAMRDHFIQRIEEVRSIPSTDFGNGLADWLDKQSGEIRMDAVMDMFCPSGTAKNNKHLSQIGNIRAYRHWVAHGRHSTSKPTEMTAKKKLMMT